MSDLRQIVSDYVYAHNQWCKFSNLLSSCVENGDFYNDYVSKVHFYGELDVNRRAAILYSVMRDNGFDLNEKGEYIEVK